MIRDQLLMAVRNVGRRRLRSFLTLLGVIIGVIAMVSVVSLGNSLSAEMYGELEKFGADVLTVTPERLTAFGHSEGGGLTSTTTGTANKLFTESDIEKIYEIGGVEDVYGSITVSAMVGYYGESVSLSINAVSDVDAWKKIELEKIDFESGRSLSGGDTYSAVIGYSVAHEVFSKDVGERKSLMINGVEFRVVGVVEEVGGMFNSVDQSVYIPINTAREIFPGKYAEDEFSAISLKVSAGYSTSEVTGETNKILFKSRDEDENTRTFTVLSAEFYQKTIGSIMGTLTGFLGAIAAISLITGGIGITNIMYASVTERTREIGIMKAVGATNRAILLLIVFESGVIGLIGGIIGDAMGVLFAYGLIWVAGSFMASGMSGFSLGLSIRPEILLLGCLSGLAVGVIAGYLPARKASKLQPVEALRHE